MAGFTRKEDSELVVARKVEKAKRVLGFDRLEMVNIGQVKTLFNELVRKMHPDSAEFDPKLASCHTLEDFRQAKDYLVKQLENNDD